ncbi:transposase [Candidatus Epulonipiscioides gigas]|nr:transposase [Epulopiscium sp. SCG-C07WGA-EpuloA2]ONI46118.1 transposase [Epulopiscium sp. SCG-C07WGA-EpuloA2]
MLLKIAKIPRSTYYEIRNRQDKDIKNIDIISEIKDIAIKNKMLYGYRRITLELKNRGFNVNHKKVLRLMKKEGLLAITRRKRKYSSYKGTIGKIANNHIKRDFEVTGPNQKWFTDVTEFNLKGEKLYLSPILDAYGRYIVSYNVSKTADLKQIKDMLEKALKDKADYSGLVFHSDQGWQYQHNSYQKVLSSYGIIQSMSRKGNSIDNGLMEGFFGIMKSEMFYNKENIYKSIDELTIAIDKYMNYYNNERIKVKLKGLTPNQFRNKSTLYTN